MSWRSNIEAQIAELRCFQVSPGKDDYCVWEGRGKCLKCQKADTMQALLDVAVAAENSMFWLHNGIVSMQKEEWDKIVDALDKLREVGDENF